MALKRQSHVYWKGKRKEWHQYTHHAISLCSFLYTFSTCHVRRPCTLDANRLIQRRPPPFFYQRLYFYMFTTKTKPTTQYRANFITAPSPDQNGHGAAHYWGIGYGATVLVGFLLGLFFFPLTFFFLFRFYEVWKWREWKNEWLWLGSSSPRSFTINRFLCQAQYTRAAELWAVLAITVAKAHTYTYKKGNYGVYQLRSRASFRLFSPLTVSQHRWQGCLWRLIQLDSGRCGCSAACGHITACKWADGRLSVFHFG